ncbi:MAG: acetolactate synthase small subunit [Acidobacteriota bacterium]
MRHTVSILVANQAGELSRATIVTIGDEKTVEQIVKQCSQLTRVQEVQVVSAPHIEREMALINVNAKSGGERQEILNLVGIFRAKVVDMSHDKIVLEASGSSDKVDTFIELLRPFGVNDVTRTGCVAVNRLSPFDRQESTNEEFLTKSL